MYNVSTILKLINGFKSNKSEISICHTNESYPLNTRKQSIGSNLQNGFQIGNRHICSKPGTCCWLYTFCLGTLPVHFFTQTSPLEPNTGIKATRRTHGSRFTELRELGAACGKIANSRDDNYARYFSLLWNLTGSSVEHMRRHFPSFKTILRLQISIPELQDVARAYGTVS